MMHLKSPYKAATFVALVISLTYSLSLHSSEVYRCIVNGKTVFTDQPCDEGEEVEIGPTNSTSMKEERDVPTYTKAYKSDNWLQDAQGYQSGLRLAKKHKVTMLIYFYTEWCGYCNAVNRNLLADPAVKDDISGYVKVMINPEHGDTEQKLFDSMGGSGYPTFLVKPFQGKARKIYVTRSPTESNPSASISHAEFIAKILQI